MYLAEIINKRELNPNTLQTVQNYISKTYPYSRQIYTDGSKKDTANFAGGGIAVLDQNQDYKYGFPLKFNKDLSIFLCELIAIIFALQHIKQDILGDCIICSDSLSALQAINSGTSHTRPDLLDNVLRSIIAIKAQNMSIQLVWVPSHIDLKGNELADELAKRGCERGRNMPVSLSTKEVYSIINRKIKAKFKAIWDKSKFKHKDFLLPAPTKLCQYSSNPLLDRAYTRLKLGASYLGGDTFGNHKYCNICNTIEDIKHVFFECTTYDEPRVELQNELLKIGPIIVSDKTLFNPPKPIAEQIRQAVFHFFTESNLLTKVLYIRT